MVTGKKFLNFTCYYLEKQEQEPDCSHLSTFHDTLLKFLETFSVNPLGTELGWTTNANINTPR